jgi:hypothetical protein
VNHVRTTASGALFVLEQSMYHQLYSFAVMVAVIIFYIETEFMIQTMLSLDKSYARKMAL